MNPIAFSIFGLGISWYGIIISFGMMLGIIIAANEAKKLGYNPDVIIDMVLWTIPAAIIGARAYYVIFEWDYFKNQPWEIFAIRNGGLAIHGGVLAAFITGYIFVRIRKLDFFKLCDIVAPSLILGQGIGRWGNFVNQEAHGGVVSEGFISLFPEFIKNQMYINGQYYHPTFLYESLWDILIFFILILFRRYKKRDGELIGIYMVLYSIGRFFIEGLRTDSLMLGNFRVAQIISAVLVLAGAMLIIYKRYIEKHKGYSN
jgi:phosphatidylglycerol:prolipoprotein diacylglycerol transferase